MSQDLLENGKKKKRGAGPIVIVGAVAAGMVAGALLYSWWSQRPAEAVVPLAEENAPPPEKSGILRLGEEAIRNGGVRIKPAELRRIRTTLVATGVVAADQSRVAHIRPIARGLVEEVHVQLGDRVSAGDPLVEYDNIELGVAIGRYLSARAELARTLTDLEVKRKILARSHKMLEVGAIARTDYDVQQAEVQDAEARVNSARALIGQIEEQIHRFGLTDEDLAKLNQEAAANLHRTASHSTLRAPFSGVITAYNVAAGELVEPSDRLMTITDISSVWVQADVYEKDVGNVREGQLVAVRVASYPGEVFRGKITYISDMIEPKTRTAKVRCVVDNKDARLKLDMFATIEIPTRDSREILAVPAAAIQMVNDRPVVFVQLAAGEFERRDVQTGVLDRGWREVRTGLKPGEHVVTEGSFYMKSALLRELIGEDE